MWYTFKTDRRWIPAVDFGVLDTKVYEPKYDSEDNPSSYEQFLYQYLTMWYNSCIALALVEVNARTQVQLTMMFIIYALNAIIQATIFGIFIDLISLVGAKSIQRMNEQDEFDNGIIIAGSFMPEDCKYAIRQYLNKTFKTKHL